MALPAALGSSSGTAAPLLGVVLPEDGEPKVLFNQLIMLLQLKLQPPTLRLLKLQLLSMPLLASASETGDTNDRLATNDNTNIKRFNMISTSRGQELQ